MDEDELKKTLDVLRKIKSDVKKEGQLHIAFDEDAVHKAADDNNVDNGHDNHAVHTTADHFDYVASGYDTVKIC